MKTARDITIKAEATVEMEQFNGDISYSETSYRGEIKATYAEIVGCFGKPTREDPSLDCKIDVEWVGLITVGEAHDCAAASRKVFTIYNWKDGKAYLGDKGKPVDQITEWHIGAHSTIIGKAVQAFFRAYQADLLSQFLRQWIRNAR